MFATAFLASKGLNFINSDHFDDDNDHGLY